MHKGSKQSESVRDFGRIYRIEDFKKLILDTIELLSWHLNPCRRIKEMESNLRMCLLCLLSKICLNYMKVPFMLKMKVKWILNHLDTVGLSRDLIWKFKNSLVMILSF